MTIWLSDLELINGLRMMIFKYNIASVNQFIGLK